MESECDMASVHALLSNIPGDIPLEKLLIDARRLHKLHPPIILEPLVKARVKRLEDEVRASADQIRKRSLERRLRAANNNHKAGKPPPPADNALLWRVFMVALPVVIGTITWKYLDYMSRQ